MFALDHLVIAATTISEGTSYIEEALGVTLAPGGQHHFMGTHNRLLSLGPQTYLEVIAIDPDLPAPERARWFGLDTFEGPARPVTWVWSADDIADAGRMPGTYSAPEALERGDLRWQMALPESSPLGVLAPAVLHWQGARPQQRLADAGVRLSALVVQHPQAASLPDLGDPRVQIGEGAPCIRFVFATPNGEVTL